MVPVKTYDHVWYVKWASSIGVLIGVALTTHSISPMNMYVGTAATLGWLYVSLKWHDRAMVVMNAVVLSVYFEGIMSHL